jgi:hypothetical protein
MYTNNTRFFSQEFACRLACSKTWTRMAVGSIRELGMGAEDDKLESGYLPADRIRASPFTSI